MAAIPTITPLPDPALSTDPEDVFNSKADATLLAQQNFVNVDMNTKVIPGINQAVADAVSAESAAAASAQTATDQAAIATGSGDAAAHQVALATAQVQKAAAQANNAAASALAAESAPGSIGNLALLQAVALTF